MAKKRSTATRREEAQAASARAAAIRQQAERRERRRRSLVVTGVAVVVLALVLVIGYLVQNSRDTSGQAGGGTPSGVVSGYSIPVGKASAGTTVTIYEDFMCPFCGQLESATRTKLQAGIDAGNVAVHYRVLDFLDRSSSTQYSLRSANAMAVVLDKAGPTVAKKFHDLLYENQPQEGSAGLSDGQLLDYAVQAGAKRSEVSAGISGRTFEQWVKNGTDQASKDGVTGTPTVLIDGKQVQGNLSQIAQQVEQAAAGS